MADVELLPRRGWTVDEFEFLRKMYFRLQEAERIDKNRGDDCGAHTAAIKCTIRDYLAMTRKEPRHD